MVIALGSPPLLAWECHAMQPRKDLICQRAVTLLVLFLYVSEDHLLFHSAAVRVCVCVCVTDSGNTKVLLEKNDWLWLSACLLKSSLDIFHLVQMLNFIGIVVVK